MALTLSPDRRPRAASRVAGASTLEFLLAGVLVLLPLTFAILEFAQLAVARNALNFAAFEAARAGSVTGIDPAAMRTALARGLVPLFASAAADGQPGGSEAARGIGALARALVEVNRPDLLQLSVENPSPAALDDFATDVDGVRAMPNTALRFRNPWGQRSGQTLRDANTLAIRVTYCRELLMPVVSYVLPLVLRGQTSDPRAQICYLQRRLPVEAVAVVHMQSPTPAARFAGR